MVNDVTSCEYETMMGVMIFQSYYYISAYSRFLLCTFPTHHMYIDICLSRDWSPKFETEINIIIGHKAYFKKRVTKLFFCQNDVLLGESFWQKDSLVTLILF